VLTPVSKGTPPGQPGAPGTGPGGATPAKTSAAAEADELPADDNETTDGNSDDAEKKALKMPKAATARSAAHSHDTIDELTAEATGGWRRTVGPMLQQVEAVVAAAKTPEELKAKLATLRLDKRALIEAVATATFKAHGLGDATDKP
jgi:hypothetical protein